MVSLVTNLVGDRKEVELFQNEGLQLGFTRTCNRHKIHILKKMSLQVLFSIFFRRTPYI